MEPTKRKYAFVMLCNNVKFFETFAKYFPHEGYDDFDFYAVYDNRLGDIRAQLKVILNSSNNKYISSFLILNGDIILNEFAHDFKYAIHDPKSLKNLKDLYFLKEYDRMFSVDDDVIIFDHINDLMEHKLAGQPWIWDTFVSAKNQRLYHEVFDFDFNKFYKNHTSVGQYVISNDYYDEYFEIVRKFYNHEHFAKIFIAKEQKYHKFRWLVDDVLTNMLFVNHMDDMHHEVFCDMILCGKTEKILFRKKKTKLRMYHYFEKNKEIVRQRLDEMLEVYFNENKSD